MANKKVGPGNRKTESICKLYHERKLSRADSLRILYISKSTFARRYAEYKDKYKINKPR